MEKSNFTNRLIIIGICASLCLPFAANADELKAPPTYQKCIGAINSAPISELEEACNVAKTLAYNNSRALTLKKSVQAKAGGNLFPLEQETLDHWQRHLASAGFHQAKWNAVRLGIKNDNACSVVSAALALFNELSEGGKLESDFNVVHEQTTHFYKQCQKNPRNEQNDVYWGLSIQVMQELVKVYDQNPEQQDAIKKFVADKFEPSWSKSIISNVYRPLRDEFSARYGLAESGLTKDELESLKTIYHGGLKLLDERNNDQIPDFIYNWLVE